MTDQTPQSCGYVYDSLNNLKISKPDIPSLLAKHHCIAEEDIRVRDQSIETRVQQHTRTKGNFHQIRTAIRSNLEPLPRRQGVPKTT